MKSIQSKHKKVISQIIHSPKFFVVVIIIGMISLLLFADYWNLLIISLIDFINITDLMYLIFTIIVCISIGITFRFLTLVLEQGKRKYAMQTVRGKLIRFAQVVVHICVFTVMLHAFSDIDDISTIPDNRQSTQQLYEAKSSFDISNSNLTISSENSIGTNIYNNDSNQSTRNNIIGFWAVGIIYLSHEFSSSYVEQMLSKLFPKGEYCHGLISRKRAKKRVKNRRSRNYRIKYK